jgi:predicted anti-sigma-YlaC factor YlaD
MDCQRVREALSARIDGEPAGLAPDRLDGHLAGCPACAGWLERAQEITRAVRLQPVTVPDLTEAVLAAVAADQRTHSPPRRPRRTVLRIAVAAAALAQLALALPVLIGADAHLSREMACFELALAVGFGLAAWRPQRARAFVPVAAVLAVALALTSVADLAGAHTTPVHETAHLAAVVQALLLWALARSAAGPDRSRRWAGAAATPA